MPSELPTPFRASRVVRVLNVVAVGASMAACQSAVMPRIGDTVVSMSTTFVAGCVWASLLRSTSKVAGLRVGWLSTVALAFLNAFATFLQGPVDQDLPKRAATALLFSLLGAVVWLPGVVIVLVAFGLPIGLSHEWAKRGLDGEDRGEALVGAWMAVLGLGALARIWWSPPVLDAIYRSLAPGYRCAALAPFAGLAAAVTSLVRVYQRRAFLGAAAAGRVPGYRVEIASSGKRLWRVAEANEDYRVAALEDEVYAEPAPRPKQGRLGPR